MKRLFWIIIVVIIICGIIFFYRAKGKALVEEFKERIIVKKEVTQRGLPKVKEKAPGLAELKLKLLATIIEPQKKSAMIKDLEKGSKKEYRINEKIYDARLIDIRPAKVILQRKNKELLILYLEPEESDFVTVVGRDKMRIDREKLRQRVSDLNQLFEELMVMPYIEKGRIHGFKIVNLKERSILGKVGLKEGDLVRAVNGMTLEGIQKTYEIYDKVKNEPSIWLEIQRGKTHRVLRYEIY